MGKLTIGGREFEVKPASVLVYKTLSIGTKQYNDELAAVGKDGPEAVDGHLVAAMDILVGILHTALVPSNPSLTREEIEALVPASLPEAVKLFPALSEALGLTAKADGSGEADRR